MWPEIKTGILSMLNWGTQVLMKNKKDHGGPGTFT